jgi:hypothetical protein
MTKFHMQTLTIEGMEGAEALHGVEHALGMVPGIRVDSVEPGRARILAEPACEGLIREALAGAGFALAAAELEH